MSSLTDKESNHTSILIQSLFDFFLRRSRFYQLSLHQEPLICEKLSELEPVLLRLINVYRRLDGLLPYEPGHVYLIEAIGANYFKIGKSKNPSKRILQISPQMPFKTRLLRSWQSNFMSYAESYLHKRFAEYRVNGEWFELPEIHVVSLVKDDFDYSGLIRNAFGMEVYEAIALSPQERELFADFLFEEFRVFPGAHFSFIELVEEVFHFLSNQKNMLGVFDAI